MRLRGLILAGALIWLTITPVAAGTRARWFARPGGDTPTRIFTISNKYAGLSPDALRRIEHAIVIQSRQLRRYWGTPVARFGPGGIPVTLEETTWAFAGHDLSRNHPYIAISVESLPGLGNRWWDADWWSMSLSHEILETLADPRLTSREVCDPVNDRSYRIKGVLVSDFVRPSGHPYR